MRARAAWLIAASIVTWAATAAPPQAGTDRVDNVQRVDRGNLVMEDIPEVPPELAQKLDRYLDYREATFRDWTPDGAILIATRSGEVEQLHLVREPNGDRRQLSFLKEPVGVAKYSPRGVRSGYVYLTDVGGNEHAQIFFQPLRDGQPGEPRLVTDGRSLNSSVVWSNDGQRIAFNSNVRNPAFYDVFIADPESGVPPRLVIESGGQAWYPLDWSPDDTKLLLWNYVSINESSVHVADLATGARRQVDPAPGRVGVSGARFARDGRGVYLISDRGSEFKQLRYFELATGLARVLSGDIPWDVEELALSPDGRYLAFTSNEDGMSRLNLLDLQTRERLAAPGLPEGTLSNLSFDPASRRLAFNLETARSPRDVFVLDLSSRALTQWTHSETGALDLARFADARLIRYPTFDAISREVVRLPGNERIRDRFREIPAFVFRPQGAGPFPVLIDIHGGPEAQYRPTFDPFVQFIVNELGYAVVAPNVRGSDGYGKSFLDLDNGYRREDAVKDIGELLKWIARQRDLDAGRVVVMGGSYGGYMTLASLVTYGEQLRGGIDTVGISNYLTFLENTSEYRRDLRRAEYGDERDPRMREFLARISPLTHAERIRAPLLVVQGLNDPRVPASESEQLVTRVRANGGQVWYLMAKDEGHGFRKKQNRDVYWRTIASFLERLAAPAVAADPRPNQPSG